VRVDGLASDLAAIRNGDTYVNVHTQRRRAAAQRRARGLPGEENDYGAIVLDPDSNYS
jgi:hypothetical protein